MKFKNLLPIILIALVIIVIVANVERTVDFYNADYSYIDNSVVLSIKCDSILSNYSSLDESLKSSKYVPDDGIILPETTIYIKEGASVLDALKKVTTQYNIQLEYSQSPNDSYVEGINYIYEFSCGELSGWMYKVNGSFAKVGCNSYVLKNNDVIEWVYTCDLGKDVGES